MKTILQLGLTVTAASLALGGCATPARDDYAAWITALSGAQEVPGPGSVDGDGIAKVHIDAAAGRVCYTLNVHHLATPTAAHIHRGAIGTSGPPVVTLETPTGGHSQACVDTGTALASDMLTQPSNYYINVHTTVFPAGAIRGQIAQP